MGTHDHWPMLKGALNFDSSICLHQLTEALDVLLDAQLLHLVQPMLGPLQVSSISAGFDQGVVVHSPLISQVNRPWI